MARSRHMRCLLAGVAGVLAFFGALLAYMVTFAAVGLVLEAGHSLYAALAAALLAGACVLPFLWSFVLIRLAPGASDDSISAGYLFACAIGGLLAVPAVFASFALAAVLLASSVLIALMGRFGVVVSRKSSPPQYSESWERDEPRCPKCGYVLYFVEQQTCPECGRRFELHEISLFRATWDGQVLRPRRVVGLFEQEKDR